MKRINVTKHAFLLGFGAALVICCAREASAQLVVPGVTVPLDWTCDKWREIYESGPTEEGVICTISEELRRWTDISRSPSSWWGFELVRCRAYAVDCYVGGEYEPWTCVDDRRCATPVEFPPVANE